MIESYRQLAGGNRPRGALGLWLSALGPIPVTASIGSQRGHSHMSLGPVQAAINHLQLCSSYQAALG